MIMGSVMMDLDFMDNSVIKRNAPTKRKERRIKRLQIYFADLNPVMGSEQGGRRPVLVIQNDVGNRFSTTTIVCVITGKTPKSVLPTHVALGVEHGLPQSSYVLCEQIRTIDKNRLAEFVCEIKNNDKKNELNKAIMISLGMA
jgi:mRNA interferase MazF